MEQKSITRAANALHISQSTLSRQIMDMEDRLGVTLFKRGRREISLTEDGEFLYQRAKEIVQLADATESNLMAGQTLSGTLRIGIGEGNVNDLVLLIISSLIENNPDISLDYQTINADKIYHDLDLGLLDFGVVWTNDGLSQFDYLDLPFQNYWGVLVKSDDPLAKKSSIVAHDFKERRLIIPQQLDVRSDLLRYLNQYAAGARVTGYYDMNYNMLAMIRAGIGVALTFDKPEYLISKEFTFIPLSFLKPIGVKLIWKPNRHLTRLSKLFLEEIKKA